MFEDASAGIEGACGGRDIIDEPHGFVFERGTVCFGNKKSVMNIFFSGLSARHFLLWKGEAVTDETGGLEWKFCAREEMFGEIFSEEFGLVKPTVAEAPGMEWDREKEIWQREITALESADQEFPEWFGEGFERMIFEGMERGVEDGLII